MKNQSALPAFVKLPEPSLLFSPERIADRDEHPLRGLSQFGPYSKNFINKVFDPIRIATIFPAGMNTRLRNLFDEFEAVHNPRERKDYLIPYPGFRRIFGVKLTPAPGLHVVLGDKTDEILHNSEQPHLALMQVLVDAMASLHVRRNEYDILLIVLPDRWEYAFEAPDGFDLHDHIRRSMHPGVFLLNSSTRAARWIISAAPV